MKPCAADVVTLTVEPARVTEVTKGYAAVPAPDVLDSTTAAPNNVPYGKQVAGDYIGSWLFTELRNGINALLRVVMTQGTITGLYWRGTGDAGSKVVAESEWDSMITNGLGPVGPLSSFSATTGTGNFYLYTDLHEEMRMTVQSEISGSAEFWIRAQATISGYGGSGAEYDDLGTGLPEDEFLLHDTVAFSVTGGTTQTISTPWISSTPTRPNWPTPAPAVGQNYSRGFSYTVGGIIDYDFQYVP